MTTQAENLHLEHHFQTAEVISRDVRHVLKRHGTDTGTHTLFHCQGA